jgi:23S rRNA pseudouridine1911/1915/1917 synthase
MNEASAISRTVEKMDAGQRLDRWLAGLEVEGQSRASWQNLIRAGCVLVNGSTRKAGYLLHEGEQVACRIPAAAPVELLPEDIPLDILHEDADILVLNKPAGLVIHPAPGHPDGTLVNALLHHCLDLGGIKGELRPGIVHRLDQDTSGVMVVAKNEFALLSLVGQFKDRQTSKEYLAIITGVLHPAEGTIRTTIGRSLRDRKKMAAHVPGGREAITHYETCEVLDCSSLVRLKIDTGRTHQIRVHMAHLKHPVLGDALYGRPDRESREVWPPRQMLHARSLAFRHPRSGQDLSFEAPIPPDMARTLQLLRKRGLGQAGQQATMGTYDPAGDSREP